MLLLNSGDKLISEHFIAQRKRFYQSCLIDLKAPFVANSFEILKEIDCRYLEPMFAMIAEVAIGEIVDETKTIEWFAEYIVFATWWDHLKYDIKNVKWLPKWFKNKLIIKHKQMSVTHTETIPLKVTRSCPHLDIPYDKRPDIHLEYLFPEQWHKKVKNVKDGY